MSLLRLHPWAWTALLLSALAQPTVGQIPKKVNHPRRANRLLRWQQIHWDVARRRGRFPVRTADLAERPETGGTARCETRRLSHCGFPLHGAGRLRLRPQPEHWARISRPSAEACRFTASKPAHLRHCSRRYATQILRARTSVRRRSYGSNPAEPAGRCLPSSDGGDPHRSPAGPETK